MFIRLPAWYPIDEFICSSNELVVAASLVVSRCKKLYPKSCQKGLRRCLDGPPVWYGGWVYAYDSIQLFVLCNMTHWMMSFGRTLSTIVLRCTMNRLTIACFPSDAQFLIKIVSTLALYYASTLQYRIIIWKTVLCSNTSDGTNQIIESKFR